MVKKHNKADSRGPKKQQKSDRSDRTIRYTGRHYITVNTAASSWVLSVNPVAWDARLIAISDSFENFRFTRVHVRVLSPSTPSTALVAQLAYSPVVPASTPTYSQLPLLPAYATGSGFVGSPLPNLILNASELHTNAVRWFRRGTSHDPEIQDQGGIYGAWSQGTSFQTSPMHVFIEYDVLLNSDMDTSWTVPRAPAPPREPSSEEKDDGIVVTTTDDLQRQVDDLARALNFKRPAVAPPPPR